MLLLYTGFLALVSQLFRQSHFFSHQPDECVLPPLCRVIADMQHLRRPLQRVGTVEKHHPHQPERLPAVDVVRLCRQCSFYRLQIPLIVGVGEGMQGKDFRLSADATCVSGALAVVVGLLQLVQLRPEPGLVVQHPPDIAPPAFTGFTHVSPPINSASLCPNAVATSIRDQTVQCGSLTGASILRIVSTQSPVRRARSARVSPSASRRSAVRLFVASYKARSMTRSPLYGLLYNPQASQLCAQSVASLWVMPYTSHLR